MHFKIKQFLNRHNDMQNYVLRTVHQRFNEDIQRKLDQLHEAALRTGMVDRLDLINVYHNVDGGDDVEELVPNLMIAWYVVSIVIFILCATPMFYATLTFLLGVRCFLPNNYLLSEAIRPISDCNYCRGIFSPLILPNLTKEEFAPYAYSTQPIILKNAIAHWPVIKDFNISYLMEVYENNLPGALDENCKYLHLRSHLNSLRKFFYNTNNNQEHHANNRAKVHAWHFDWNNCNLKVLKQIQQLYPRPHFLPKDAEISSTDYIIFLAHEHGDLMHFTHITRLIWQAQLQGNKSCIIKPKPECDHVCQSFSFHVETGDAVLVDPRIWYHGTAVGKAQFAITIQSEYG